MENICETCSRGNCLDRRKQGESQMVISCNFYCKQTNADKIRGMTDEELEDFIRKVAIHFEPWCNHHCKMNGDDNCNECLAKWLKKPAED